MKRWMGEGMDGSKMDGLRDGLIKGWMDEMIK